MALQSLRNGWQQSAEFVQNKLRAEVKEFLRKHAEAELFVVTGAAGMGKSSFIKSITGENVYVGSTLESGTTTTSLVPAVIGNKRCLFLDMPGFSTRDFHDWDIFERLMAGLSVVQPYVQFRGVLYVDSMKDNRVTAATERVLKWLFCFCGAEFMPNVTVVTTQWDELNTAGVKTKLSRFGLWKSGDLLEPFFDNGADVYHHGLIQDGNTNRTLHIDEDAGRRRFLARQMIASRYEGPTTLKLQIHTEIANGAALESTQAGRWLRCGHFEYHPRESEGTAGGASLSDSDTDDSDEEEATPNHDNPNTTTGGWGEQFSGFWSDPERIRPWVNLLFQAAKMYISAPRGPSMPSFTTSDGDFGYDGFFGTDFPDLYEAPDVDMGSSGNFDDDPIHQSNSGCFIL
ncbi:uncharacterized protein BJX67DRAFT_374564 [Aspergillus lucknowensis]|uniref:G domain-containing protein n=1 Tax=Aspergillus lucknowensis TaxID=176173 RepID=A0ABR4LFN9_9EURO